MDAYLYSEGHYIRTVDGLFFAVKGGRHNDGIVLSTLRYIPSECGEREYLGRPYKRVYDVESTTKFLEENYPKYINYIDWLGMDLQSVPESLIEQVYDPRLRLQDIMSNPQSSLEKTIFYFVNKLSEKSGVSLSNFGISGSVLIGLETEVSDIDLNIYGEKEGREVYVALKELRRELAWVSGYDEDDVWSVLLSRWGETGLNLEQMRSIECRKILHGKIRGVDYFIRLLIEEDQSVSEPLTRVTVSGTITDDSKSIYIPCTYRVEDIKNEDSGSKCSVVELKSYRGKFTEQVKKGEKIMARGTLERVHSGGDTYYRLILGKKEDYLLSIW
ncbi:hypothetical protein GF326_07585 [Candidatus Bathyarchaeota archaeon]|nr:hypothetical protein [Candidatus Bathyarchaeota archaeon]